MRSFLLLIELPKIEAKQREQKSQMNHELNDSDSCVCSNEEKKSYKKIKLSLG